jgi:hypothetical protein
MKFSPGPQSLWETAVFDPLSIGISAGTSLIGGLISSGAASNAADVQAGAADRASAAALAQAAQTREDLAPYRGYGTTAGGQLINRLTQLTSPFNPTMADLEATPGYQFTRDQGLKSVQNAAAAKGLGISGAALKGAANYATGLADSTYKTQFDVDSANKTNSFNKLLALTQVGAGAASNTGHINTQGVQNANNFATSGAAAQAAGGVAGANAITSGLNNVAGLYNTYTLLNRLRPANAN